MKLLSSATSKNIGLLILRLGIGVMFIGHGLPKLVGGKEKWESVGSAVRFFGVTEYYEFFGYAAAFIELGGGFLLLAGLFSRVISLLLLTVMIVAALKHILQGELWYKGASHAIEAGIVFLSLFFIGPGKFSLDYLLFGPGEAEAIETEENEV